MDFLVELLIQLLVQFVVEVLVDLLLETAFHGIVGALRSAIGRYVVGAAIGVGFGIAWGSRLNGGATWPKLLWVSVALAAGSAVLAAGRTLPAASPDRSNSHDGWRAAFSPPWQWSAERLLGFSILNVAIAGGIAASFRPGFA